MAEITAGVVELFSIPLTSKEDQYGVRYFQKTFVVPVVNGNAADEFIDTGLTSVSAVVGCVCVGTAVGGNLPSIVLDADGTGVTEGDDPGHLGVEADASTTYHITVVGYL